MPGATLTHEREILRSGGTGGGTPGSAGGGDDAGRRHPSSRGTSSRIYYTGISLALAAIVMFFMALVSAYIVRKGQGGDWRPINLPQIVWMNTLVLVASSVTLEASRRAYDRDDAASFRLLWGATTVLGLAFLAGQYIAWRQLAAAGIYIASNPSSSFFYLLTAAHAVHLFGGIAALFYVLARGWANLQRHGGIPAAVTGVYWHFMDGLWVFLLLVLQMGR